MNFKGIKEGRGEREMGAGFFCCLYKCVCVAAWPPRHGICLRGFVKNRVHNKTAPSPSPTPTATRLCVAKGERSSMKTIISFITIILLQEASDSPPTLTYTCTYIYCIYAAASH